MVMGTDMAIDTGIFDFGNVNFLSELPGGLGPQTLKNKGSVSWQYLLNIGMHLTFCNEQWP